MSRHEEEIDGERPVRSGYDWTDDYQCLVNDAAKREAVRVEAIRGEKIGSLRADIMRLERSLIYRRQDLARLLREGEPQLQLGDQPTFAPEWPHQRKTIDRGQ